MSAEVVKRAAFPSAFLFQSSTDKKPLAQLLWGEYARVLGPAEDGRVPVRAARRNGWMNEKDLQEERPLEIVFVDIGQGDGALLITPEDHKMLIDAGEGDNMWRFLRWRFGKFKIPMRFDSVVMSHGDADHWGGFGRIFAEPKLRFGTVYLNGLVERLSKSKTESLGPRKNFDGRQFVTGLVTDIDEVRQLVTDQAIVGSKKYAALLRTALESKRVGDIQMLGRSAGKRRFLPGYEAKKPLSIEVLGPIVEQAADQPGLRWFGDVGKTKNGHSIVLKVRYGEVSILLGGDLNTLSEDLLLSTHTGLPSPPKGAKAEAALIAKGRRTFQVDFAKACHHGSADFSSVFLSSVNPMATIVSSGDEESFAHPRPDALGAYGRCGRPPRPLIFSTELFRSSAERVKYPNRYKRELLAIVDSIVEAKDEAARKRGRARLDKQLGDIERSVAVYGAINLRTDGRRAIIAYRIEKPTSAAKQWQLYMFKPDAKGQLILTDTR